MISVDELCIATHLSQHVQLACSMLSSVKEWQAIAQSLAIFCNAAYDIDFSVLSGLAPPEGWRAPASTHRRVKAVDSALRQGGALDDCCETLQELFECFELDYDLCEVTLCTCV